MPSPDLPSDSSKNDELDTYPVTSDDLAVRNAYGEVARRIGDYTLIERIGSGGMGEVWVAEQTQPVRRQVALKLIKPGTGSHQVVARFEAERQALAMMNHPNIARILDAGTTDDGQPYFVMELVLGSPLTEYCDQRKLSVEERLGLFIEICGGIQHAHQKGIIHRDLKPGNILVTEVDGEAVPKIIDFGLAKAFEETARFSVQSQTTEVGQILGTALYMSPEQASLGKTDIDTRSDIYTLGVILYEQLTGRLPLDSTATKAGATLDMQEIIREVEPVKPSSRLSSCSNDQRSQVNELRRTDSARLHRILSGDLDWIVMKALDKDRSRRYDSASGFAADIRRYLNSEPVIARPPSLAYRLKKYVRKNRGLVASLATITTLLITGTIISTWFAVDASVKSDLLQSSVQELTEKDESNQVLVKQGSQLAFRRGIDAWHEGKPADAIAHFTTSLQMWSENDEAKHWLDHALASYRQQGWHPPYWIFGGGDDTAKAALSQDGRYVALQSSNDNTVTIVDTLSKQPIGKPHELVGVLDDLYSLDAERFLLLTVDVRSRQAMVWKVVGDSISRISQVQSSVDEGELEFSQGGRFLVRQIERQQHTIAYRVSNGERFSFNPESPGQPFHLSVDDTTALAKSENGYRARWTVDRQSVAYRDVSIPDFSGGQDTRQPTEAPPSEPTPAAPVPDAGVKMPLKSPFYYTAAELSADSASQDDTPDDDLFGSPSSNTDPAPQQIPEQPQVQYQYYQGPIPIGFRSTGRSRAVISDGMLEDAIPASAFVSLFPFSSYQETKLLISSFDLELQSDSVELQFIELQVEAPSFFSNPFSTLPSLIFVEDTRKILAVTHVAGTGGCGEGVPCEQPRFRLDLIWDDARYQHIKSPGLDVFDAVIDSNRPQALLMSRPLSAPSMQLYDFSNARTEPTTLSIPATDYPTNRLESYFVGPNSEVVCRFARNAVGMWETNSTNGLQLQPVALDFSVGASVTYESAISGTKTRVANFVRKEGYLAKYFRRLATVAGDSLSSVTPAPSCIRRNDQTVLCLLRIDLKEVTFVCAHSLQQVLCVQLDLAPEKNIEFEFDPTGRYLAVIGHRNEVGQRDGQVSRDGDRRSDSILESDSSIMPCFSIFDSEQSRWTTDITDGIFAGFHPASSECMYLSGDTLYMLKLTYGTPREVMSDIVTASFSPSGELIAAVDRQNSMILYKVINNELIPSGERFRLPNSELNQSITDIGFDEACEKVWIAYSGYDSYYANSPGCADCGINASTAPTDTSSLNHLVVIELASGEIRGFANIILVQPLLTVDDDGMLIGHYDFGPRTLGPVPYTYGVYWEKDFIMTVTQEHQGDAYSLSHKIEFWNVRTGMPESLPIRLGSPCRYFQPAVAWTALEHSFRVFIVLEDGTLHYRDFPSRKSEQFLDKNVPINFEFLYALAGKTLGSLGELRPISLAERVRVLKASMDHMDSLRAATSTSSKTEQLIGVGGSASQFAREHSNFNPNSLDQSPEPLSSWTNSPKLHEVTFQIGFEFDDGIFLANSNDRTWWLVHKKRKQLTELVWQGEQDGQVVLKDRLRELVYHVPKFGGQATIQGNSPKITRPWRLTTAVPSR